MVTPGTTADAQAVQALQTEVQGIIGLLRDPGAQGEPNYENLRNAVGLMQTQLFPTPGQNLLTYEQVRDAALDTARERPKVRQEIEDTKARVEQVATTIEPIIRKADEQLKALNDQAETVKKITESELGKQQKSAEEATTKYQELIQHAQNKFQEIEVKQTDLFTLAGTKFQEIEAYQQGLTQAAKARFDEMDQRFASLGTLMKMLETMRNDDVTAIREKLAAQGLRDGGPTHSTPYKRAVSEFKAVGNLIEYASDSRTGLKVWLGKFKNAISQSRGPEWEDILDQLENHRISTDFEELTSQDDQWDSWFESKFGSNRTDGEKAVDLREFKADLFWVLKDKLGEQYITIIQKYGKNGLRAYKKLYTWSVDISDEAKQLAMNEIMNPKPAKSDAELASHIEAWDYKCAELLKVDSKCELKDPFRLVAFKSLLTNTMSTYIINQIDPAFTNDYDFIRSKVYAWALRQRFTHKATGGMNAMNIPDDIVTGTYAGNYDSYETPNAAAMGWGGGQGSWDWDPAWGPMEAMGAGKQGFKGGKGKGGAKGKGKGAFTGQCYNCGKYGHRAAECRGGKQSGQGGKKGGKGGYKGGKGKGTPGKGMHQLGDTGQYGEYGAQEDGGMAAVTQFQGVCHGCNQWGHSWKYCRKTNPNALPEPTGKGGGAAQSGGVQQMVEGAAAAGVPPKAPAASGAISSIKAMSFGGKMESLNAVGPTCKNGTCQDLKCTAGAGWFKGSAKLPGWNFDLLALPKTADKKVHWDDSNGEIQEATGGNMCPVKRTEPDVQWKLVKLTVDSGACDHVLNKSEIPGAEIKETEAVRKGVTYTSACGTSIRNLGEIDIEAVTEDGVNLDLTAQVADVKQPLAAVRKICKAGNRVVFDDEESECYIENKETKARTQISFEDGTYAVKLWVPIKQGDKKATTKGMQETTGKKITPTFNRFEVFEEAEQDWETFDADFRRLA